MTFHCKFNTAFMTYRFTQIRLIVIICNRLFLYRCCIWECSKTDTAAYLIQSIFSLVEMIVLTTSLGIHKQYVGITDNFIVNRSAAGMSQLINSTVGTICVHTIFLTAIAVTKIYFLSWCFYLIICRIKYCSVASDISRFEFIIQILCRFVKAPTTTELC